MNDLQELEYSTPYELLARKIIERAVLDWRSARQVKSDAARFRVDEIRSFFRGDWCGVLLSCTNISGEWLLSRLEEEPAARKKNAARGSCVVTIDGTTATIGRWCQEIGIESSYMYTLYKKHGREHVEERLSALKEARGL